MIFCRRSIHFWDSVFIKGKQFKDLYIKFIATAVDIKTGQEILFNQGDVAKAVRASIAIPGVFAPLHLHKMILVDGGVVDPVPVKCIKDKVDKVIAVASTLHLTKPRFKRMPHPEKHQFINYLFDKSMLSLKEQLKQSKKVSRTTLFFFNPKKLKSLIQGPPPEIFVVTGHSYHITLSQLTKLSLELNKTRCGN